MKGTRDPAPLTAFRDVDRKGLLDNVSTLNFHPHLPHYALTSTDRKSVQVLARQPVDLDRPHPFTSAGNREFNCLLWMPPTSTAPEILYWWTRRISPRFSAARIAWKTFGGIWL